MEGFGFSTLNLEALNMGKFYFEMDSLFEYLDFWFKYK